MITVALIVLSVTAIVSTVTMGISLIVISSNLTGHSAQKIMCAWMEDDGSDVCTYPAEVFMGGQSLCADHADMRVDDLLGITYTDIPDDLGGMES